MNTEPTNEQLQNAANLVYALLHSRDAIMRDLGSKSPWMAEDQIIQVLEWGWEHQAPVGKRYQPRHTHHLRLDIDLVRVLGAKAEGSVQKLAQDVDTLIEQARQIAATHPLDYAVLQGQPRGNCKDTTVVVFIRLVSTKPFDTLPS